MVLVSLNRRLTSFFVLVAWFLLALSLLYTDTPVVITGLRPMHGSKYGFVTVAAAAATDPNAVAVSVEWRIQRELETSAVTAQSAVTLTDHVGGSFGVPCPTGPTGGRTTQYTLDFTPTTRWTVRLDACKSLEDQFTTPTRHWLLAIVTIVVVFVLASWRLWQHHVTQVAAQAAETSRAREDAAALSAQGKLVGYLCHEMRCVCVVAAGVRFG